ncbi:Zn-dependent exopeptidase [Hesseltinella vesiculosa]|uniref:Peptide hydrolase n=1 Tax=Hesseltinella vesiculosa TaxID=101127 RepID=A0A1X2GEL9_9FUNG|nr:Zn-dependent exopeptidase [Hesseltinella vesiculosa]
MGLPLLWAMPTKRQSNLEMAITEAGLLRHLNEFQVMADKYNHTRLVGTPAHEETLDYIIRFLESFGYNVHQQEFTVFRPDVSSHSVHLTKDNGQQVDFNVNIMHNSPSTSDEGITAKYVPNAFGCERLSTKPTGPWIALVERGNCSFTEKQHIAQLDGALAVLVYNTEDQQDDFEGKIDPQTEDRNIPIGAISWRAAHEIMAPNSSPILHVRMQVDVIPVVTRNIIAETQGGNKENVIMIGAHTDSVMQGPGINDDGSGVTTLLEIAAHIDQKHLTNAVRFAWWSAEELGTLGSKAYVEKLPSDQRKRIAAYLNIDMIGSPNHVNMIYDGDGSNSKETGLVIPVGNAAIESLFIKYFEDNHEYHQPIGLEYMVRSDAGAFFEAGIPFGGLTSGFEFIKTELEQQEYGGQAGKAHDPCYHQACDTVHDIDAKVLLLHARGYAHAIDVYSHSTATLG